MALRRLDKCRFSGPLVEEYRLFKIACPHHDRLQRTVAQELVDWTCQERTRRSVLEVGCGIGTTTWWVLDLLQKSRQNIRITSVDYSEEMLRQAREHLGPAIRRKRLALAHADGLAFLQSLPSASYDGFFSVFTLHNCTQEYRSAALTELHRILRPGSLFVNGDKYALDDSFLHEATLRWQLAQFDRFDKLGTHNLKEEWIKHYHEDNQPDRIMKESESIARMEDIGFRNARIVFREQMEAVLVAQK